MAHFGPLLRKSGRATGQAALPTHTPLQIKNTTVPWYVCDVYRPPSGSKSGAIAELEKIMQCLPNKKVIILGDFNYDFLKPYSQQFESAIYGNNKIPHISLATHFKPVCNPSSINNILTNFLLKTFNHQVFLRVVLTPSCPISCFIKEFGENPKLKIHPIETQNMTTVNQT